MRDSLRAVLSLQSRKIGQPRFPSFASRMHVGADSGLTLSVVYLDDLYKEANDLFWKTTGYKVGQRLDPNNPDDAKMMATWTALLGQITASHINKDTNDNFWKQTNYKVGQKLDPKIAADKAKIPIWISINTQVKAAYSKLPRIPAPSPTPSPAPTFANSPVSETLITMTTPAAKAEVHQVQADTVKAQAVEAAKVAVTAAAAGDTAKAEAHTVQSNKLNAEADLHQQQANFNKEIVKKLVDVKSLSELSYIYAKLWAGSPIMSHYLGWAIKEDGSVDTKWTDTYDEITSWFASLPSFGGYYVPGPKVLWGLYWEKGFTDSSGVLIPVKEYSPSITQAQSDYALSKVTGRPSLKDAPQLASSLPPTPEVRQAGGGGGAIAVMVALGGGLLMVAAKGKKR